MAACLATIPSIRASADDVKPAAEKKQKPLAWARKPVKEWPQFVLTNEASFKGHTSLNGASSFLLRTSDNDILLVTARHLIGAEGGVEPPVALTDFDKALKKWEAYPRTKPQARVAIKGLAMNESAGARHDWLLLHLTNPKSELPATPMRARIKRANVGDVAYLIGVPYADKKSAQNVYKGKVTGRPGRNYFQFEFEPAVKLAGFSGAPVVDEDGYLLGMMTTCPESKRKDGLQTVCWCQDISMGYSLWKKRNETPAPKAECNLRLKLPAGWKSEPSNTEFVVVRGTYGDSDASISVQAFPPEAREEGVKFVAWVDEMKKIQVGDKLEDRRETELTPVKIGRHKGLQYEVTGTSGGVGLTFRVVFFEHSGCYCYVLAWSLSDDWSKAQPRFDEVFNAIE